jgi:hypothetical protein
MFHAPMGRFQLELIYFNYQFFHRHPIQQLFFFFPVGLSSLSLQHPTRPVENVTLATKAYRKEKHNC